MVDGGAVVSVSSMNAVHPTSPGLFAYDASKAGVLAFTRSAALELASRGIRINAVLPGGTRTPGALRATAGGDMRPEMLARIPLRRSAHPSEIADVVVFLASPMARYITGEHVLADGGYQVS
jgi:2-deoxy-D-gluconate 3-dehydrogenase